MTNGIRIGVFGGSFDPPHRAHVELVRHVLGSGEIDRVWVVPVFAHAFGKQLAPFEDRMEMCRLAFADVANVEVSSIESTLPVPNYTLTTLGALVAAHPNASWRLLVGGDVLARLDEWHRIEEVKALAPLLVMGRVGHEGEGAPAAVLPDISSTEVRALVAEAREATLSQFVPVPVAEYISKHGLYR